MRTRPSLLACLLMVVSVAVYAGKPVENYYGKHDPEHLWAVEKYHLQPAYDKAHRKDPKAATYAWDDIDFILRHFPNHPKALLIATDLSLRLNARARVEKKMKRAVEYDPDPPETWIIYGIFLHRWGDYAGAVTKYEQALQRDPENAEAWYNMGLAYFELGKYDEAAEAAKKAYALGYPLPGLRHKLQRVGHWRAPSKQTQPAPHP